MWKDLNDRHHRWLEFLIDVDIDIAYHPGRVMENALSMGPD